MLVFDVVVDDAVGAPLWIGAVFLRSRRLGTFPLRFSSSVQGICCTSGGKRRLAPRRPAFVSARARRERARTRQNVGTY